MKTCNSNLLVTIILQGILISKINLVKLKFLLTNFDVNSNLLVTIILQGIDRHTFLCKLESRGHNK